MTEIVFVKEERASPVPETCILGEEELRVKEEPCTFMGELEKSEESFSVAIGSVVKIEAGEEPGNVQLDEDEMSSDGAHDSYDAGNNVTVPVHSYLLTPRGTLRPTGSPPVLAVVRSEDQQIPTASQGASDVAVAGGSRSEDQQIPTASQGASDVAVAGGSRSEEQQIPTASQGASDVAVAGGSGLPSSSRCRLRARRSLPLHDERIANMMVDSGSEDDYTDDDEDEEFWDPTHLRRQFNLSRQERLERENEREESGDERTNYEHLEDMDEDMDVGMNVDESGPRVSTEFQWSDDFTSFSGQKETYRREPGPTVKSQDPTEIFLKIWDEHIMGLIADETNCHARQIIEMFTDPDLDTHIPKYLELWEEVTIPVMYQYFAAMIFMSFCVRTKIQEYWEMNRLEMPKFREIMTRDKFLLITKFLHFVSDRESTARGYDRKIGKVAPILDHCNRKFSELYIPDQHISLDESLLLWKGHLSWRQCIRSKAARFGIKSFDLCEATSGYLLKCKLYTGKETPMHSGPLHGFSNKSAQVVLDLMEGYLDAGHVLVMDNWYNQLYLTRYLKSRGTDVLGTLNRTRKDVPQELKDLKQNQVARGEWHARHSGDIALVTWKDVKLVTVMSTYHDHQMVPGRRAGVSREKPVSVREYNKYMGGVDLKDQKLSTFLFERKRGHKWYIKVFRRFVNTSLLNAFIIYTKNPMYRLCSHREFRFAVAEGLLARFGTTRGALPPSITVNQELRLQPGNHFPVYTEKLPNKAEHRKRYCERCKMVKKRSQVRTMCRLCQVPLCIGQCWADYHSRERLSNIPQAAQHE